MNTDDEQDKDLHFRVLATAGRQQRANMIEDYTEERDASLIYINIGPELSHPPRCPLFLSAVCAREIVIGKRFDSLSSKPAAAVVRLGS